MKRTLKLLMTTAGFMILVVIVGFYFFTRQYGRAVIEDQLSRVLQRNVVVNEVGVVFPLGIRASGLQIAGVGKIEDARIHLGLPIILGDQLVIAKLFLGAPVAVIQRAEDERITLGPVSLTTGKSANTVPGQPVLSGEAPRTSIRSVAIQYLEVDRGQVQYFDLDHDAAPERWDIDGIELKARNVVFPPGDIQTKFHLSGQVLNAASPVSGSQFEGQGWINPVAKDMKASLKLADPNGQMALTADFNAVRNDMMVKGQFNASRLSSSVNAAADGESIDDLVFGALQSTGFDLILDFQFKTKLDAFHIEPIAFSGSIGADIAGGGVKPDLRKIGRQFEGLGKQLNPESSAPDKEVLAQ